LRVVGSIPSCLLLSRQIPFRIVYASYQTSVSTTAVKKLSEVNHRNKKKTIRIKNYHLSTKPVDTVILPIFVY